MGTALASPVRVGLLLGGRYRLGRRIGSGGMASVWLARDEQLGREVAVKIVSDVLADDHSYLERFRREARVSAGFSHPNLVRVFDFSATGERPYLVMEYVAGGTLGDRIDAAEAGAMDVERLGIELLGALDHIHSAGVVHRDVKPANVLIGADGRARLTDFGIAQPEDATKLTGTGQVMGTLRYIAPEVLDGKPATPAADLYSCGVVLRDVAGGAAGPRLAAAVDALTAPDPAARPASAAAARAMLGDTEPQPMAAPADPIPTTGRRPRRREIQIPAWAVVLALAALLAGVGVVAALGGGSSSPPGDSRARGDRQGPLTQTATETVTSEESPPPAGSGPEQAEEAGAPKASGSGPKEKSPAEKLPPGQAKKDEKGD
jgi:hypothetical protein